MRPCRKGTHDARNALCSGSTALQINRLDLNEDLACLHSELTPTEMQTNWMAKLISCAGSDRGVVFASMKRLLSIFVWVFVGSACGPATNRPAATPPLTQETRPRPIPEAPPGSSEAPPEAGTAAGGLGKAPAGAFMSTTGTVELAKLWGNGGIVVVFYRGHWCKQCRLQLKEFQAAIAEFRGRGYSVVAVSTDPPETSLKLKNTLNLDFELLSDAGGLRIIGWGVYSREHDLARPAVFVIKRGGNILFKAVSDTPSDRPSIKTLLGVIDNTASPE